MYLCPGNNVTQTTVDDFLLDPLIHKCCLPFPEDVPFPASSHLVDTINKYDENNKLVAEESVCNGIQSYSPQGVINSPCILQVTIPVGTMPETQTKSLPAKQIKFGEQGYNLAAIIYSTSHGTHFKTHIIIHGKPLFFDGMMRPVLKWDNWEYLKTNLNPICHVWYLNDSIKDITENTTLWNQSPTSGSTSTSKWVNNDNTNSEKQLGEIDGDHSTTSNGTSTSKWVDNEDSRTLDTSLQESPDTNKLSDRQSRKSVRLKETIVQSNGKNNVITQDKKPTDLKK